MKMEGDSCSVEDQSENTAETKDVNNEGNGETEKNNPGEAGDSTDNLPENVFSINRSFIPTVPQTDQVNK